MINEVYTIFKNYFSNEALKPILDQSLYLQIYLQIIKTRFEIHMGESINKVNSDISSIMERVDLLEEKN